MLYKYRVKTFKEMVYTNVSPVYVLEDYRRDLAGQLFDNDA